MKNAKHHSVIGSLMWIVIAHYLFSSFLSSILQSGYFSSMFSGSWKESNMMEINLEIPDQNIDTEGESQSRENRYQQDFLGPVIVLLILVCLLIALQVVFGSLYRDDVLIKPSRVVSILAAACMLQLVST